MAATASVHHQQMDGVAAHVEHTKSHALNLTGLAVINASAPPRGAADGFVGHAGVEHGNAAAPG